MPLNIIVIILIIAFDQIVKWWASYSLRFTGSIPVVGNAIQFTYAENKGAAFSSFTSHTDLLIVISAVFVVVALILLIKYYRSSALLRWSLLFIIGGAIGNLIDRVRLSYVVDMIDFRIINFPIFNVADSFISIGAVILVIYALKDLTHAGRKRRGES
ncbi:MAG: signal peptidase II [Clostridia bacterium]|nr:signal peptidase II [Clostridia bacterium]